MFYIRHKKLFSYYFLIEDSGYFYSLLFLTSKELNQIYLNPSPKAYVTHVNKTLCNNNLMTFIYKL